MKAQAGLCQCNFQTKEGLVGCVDVEVAEGIWWGCEARASACRCSPRCFFMQGPCYIFSTKIQKLSLTGRGKSPSSEPSPRYLHVCTDSSKLLERAYNDGTE